MIIVKDKGAKSPIYVPRNTNIQPSINNSGEGGIDKEELNKYLEDYVTETELDDKDYATNTKVNDKQDRLVSGLNIKTINGENILGEGNIDIAVVGGPVIPRPPMFDDGTSADYAYVVEVTQSQYDNLTEKIENTLYIITDAPAIDIPDTSNFATKTDLNRKQNTLVSGQNIKTINGESILGSGNITIEGGSGGGEIPEGVKPTYYLWKETSSYGNSTMLNDNKNVRNILLTYAYSEEFPFVVLKDNYNDTISNNLYIKSNYVEIQCCNSRVGGKNSDLIDERYELTVDGWLKEVKKETVASQNWVYEKLGDIETVLDNIIGDSNGGGDNGSSIFPL